MNNKAVTQYLQRYAEPEVNLLNSLPPQHYHHVLVIPAYLESPHFLKRCISSQWFRENVLLILVINQPETGSDCEPQQTLHRYARKHSRSLWGNQYLELLEPITNAPEKRGHILLIDRYSYPLPYKQGVGLARKIGSDLALALIQRGCIKTEWIASSDADASLPGNYFSALSGVGIDTVAACYTFEHIGNDPAINAATLIYQRSLHYYVAGLRYAGSPYAYHTIGSTLAFKAIAYAAVRGFPKRAAGEDFYLLNKLAKTGHIQSLKQPVIQLEARLSGRVPFGTGVSAAKIMQLRQDGESFYYYHPKIFSALHEVLTHFKTLWGHQDNLSTWLEKLPTTSAEALLNLGLAEFINKQSRQQHSDIQFFIQLTAWFDALKTLRFIHGLRDSTYPNLPLDEAISQATFSAS